MSELTKLLEGVKVEWKTLGEISELYGGLKGKSKNDFTDGNAKYVTYKNIFNNIEINFDTLETVKVSPNENQYEIRYGDVLFTGSSEIASEAGMSSSVTKSSDTKIYLNSFSFGLRFNQNVELIPEFTKYLFRSKYMRDAIAKTASGVTRYNISKKRFIRLQIPIPCPDNPERSLQIQQEIVRILDSLSEETNQLTAALQKELQIHKKRYDFYREELFRFEGKEVEWKCLGEVSKVLRGRRLTKSQLTSDGYPVYHGGLEPLGFYHEFNRPSESVMIINVGASAGNVGYSSNHFWSSDGCYCLKQIENLNTKYLFYFLLSQEFYLKSKVRYAGIPTLDSAIIEKIKIPIPCPRDLQKSLEIQKEIVQLLDQFDEATITIAAQLKKEIALRNKQYQYYRDRLLSFQSLQTEVEAIQ